MGVVDLTRGEMGSRGTAEQRIRESEQASRILGLDKRVNLELPDGGLEQTLSLRTRLVEILRELRPRLVIAPYWENHHPDHAATSLLVKDAWWFAGVRKHPGAGDAFRPEILVFSTGRYRFQPSFILDITDEWETKRAAVAAYASQLHDPDSDEPQISTSSPDFLDALEGRHRYFGSLIGVPYGEPYLMRSPVPITDPLHLITGDRGVF